MYKTILTLILVVGLSIAAGYGQNKRIAVAKPKYGGGNVTPMKKDLLQSSIQESIGKMKDKGWMLISRDDIDAIMDELNFEQSGKVSEDEKKRIGNLHGVDYLCISQITEEDGALLINAYLLNLKGEIGTPTRQLIKTYSVSAMEDASEQIAKKLTGIDKIEAQQQAEAQNQQKYLNQNGIAVPKYDFYVAPTDEPSTYTFNQAINACTTKGAGWQLPSYHELDIIYDNKQMNLDFDGYYWSTTEHVLVYLYPTTFKGRRASPIDDEYGRYYKNMNNGYSDYTTNLNEQKKVRCIRKP